MHSSVSERIWCSGSDVVVELASNAACACSILPVHAGRLPDVAGHNVSLLCLSPGPLASQGCCVLGQGGQRVCQLLKDSCKASCASMPIAVSSMYGLMTGQTQAGVLSVVLQWFAAGA